jgi:hypothetical protein
MCEWGTKVADIVASLQASDIVTTGCCCGHGKYPGEIRLADGRRLLVVDMEDNRDPATIVKQTSTAPGKLSKFWRYAL